jgi:prepilin-type processing-associated H-X9-DG protein
VVIALIVIVAALLFPVFTMVREHGRRVACISNLRQFAGAYALYVQDNDESFPLVTTSAWVTTPAESRPPLPARPVRTSYWANAIQPYLKDYHVFKCPSTQEADWLSADNVPVYPFSYTYNGLLTGYPMSGIVSPSKCILQMEGIGNYAVRGFTMTNPQIYDGPMPYDPDRSECAFFGGINLGSQVVDWKMGLHDGGSNFLYVDGHTKWVRHPSDVKSGGVFASYDPLGGFSYWWDGRCPTNFRPTNE